MVHRNLDLVLVKNMIELLICKEWVLAALSANRTKSSQFLNTFVQWSKNYMKISDFSSGPKHVEGVGRCDGQKHLSKDMCAPLLGRYYRR